MTYNIGEDMDEYRKTLVSILYFPKSIYKSKKRNNWFIVLKNKIVGNLLTYW